MREKCERTSELGKWDWWKAERKGRVKGNERKCKNKLKDGREEDE